MSPKQLFKIRLKTNFIAPEFLENFDRVSPEMDVTVRNYRHIHF